MDFYNSTNGRIDELFIKKLDMQGLSGVAALDFSVAYKQYAAENDRLEILVSTNCGTSWTSVFNKAGATLSTSPGGQTTAFVPTAAQWRAESVDLTSYIGQPEVLVKFKATSNYGNNMYIDDINLNVTTSIAENELEKAIVVYPTLTSGIVNIDANFTKEVNLKVAVYNAVGQEVVSNVYGKASQGISVSNYRNGKFSKPETIFTDKEIAEAGGGIQTTVNATRNASIEELTLNGLKLLNNAIKHGTTTIEIKSGYSLNFEGEMKQLEAIKQIKNTLKSNNIDMNVVSTFMAAHDFPKELKGSKMNDGEFDDEAPF